MHVSLLWLLLWHHHVSGMWQMNVFFSVVLPNKGVAHLKKSVIPFHSCYSVSPFIFFVPDLYVINWQYLYLVHTWNLFIDNLLTLTIYVVICIKECFVLFFVQMFLFSHVWSLNKFADEGLDTERYLKIKVSVFKPTIAIWSLAF